MLKQTIAAINKGDYEVIEAVAEVYKQEKALGSKYFKTHLRKVLKNKLGQEYESDSSSKHSDTEEGAKANSPSKPSPKPAAPAAQPAPVHVIPSKEQPLIPLLLEPLYVRLQKELLRNLRLRRSMILMQALRTLISSFLRKSQPSSNKLTVTT